MQPTAPEELNAVVARARAAQPGWAAVTPYERARRIAKVKDRLLDRAEAVAAVVRAETRKPLEEALLGEVLPSADVVHHWCAVIETLLEPEELALDRMVYPHKEGTLLREPRGIVALISPWNLPFALPLRTLVPALLAGNAVIFKPSEVTPKTGALLVDLFEGVVPPGVLQLVQGDGSTGAALCAEDVDLVSFTGSVAGGRKVAHACAERLVPCSLELGGKDAAIVLADANLERAAQGIVWGAMMNAGQNCAAVERVYVEAKIAEAFTARVVEIVRELRTEDVAPLTTGAQRELVARHVAAAREGGARVLCGGEPANAEQGSGLLFAPTVLAVTSDDSALMRDETFGPVVPIAVVADAEEAIARANASRYGLTASIWTRDVKRGVALGRRLRVGVITINNHAFTGALPAAPWSGQRESGYGVTGSAGSLDALTRPRFVLVDRSGSARELWWYPYTPALRTIALALATLRSGTQGLFAKTSALAALLGALPRRWRR